MITGRVGIWSPELRTEDPAAISDAAAELDWHGWGTLWIPGLGGGDILRDSERLLQVTDNAAVATGVVSIWRYRAAELAAGHARLQSAYERRFLLGLGVSDAAAARDAGEAHRPLAALGAYLDELDRAADPLPADERIVAALGPKMTELAGRRSAGTHPFMVPPDYTASARALLGAQPLLAPYQAVVVERDPARARGMARAFLGPFVGMGHYTRNLLRQGFTEQDLAGGGSDRLIDAVVAWGDVDSIGERVRAHHDAGADHVALHVITDRPGLPLAEWRRLAPLAR
jgi:probable F420-dependent oxidoreductase